MRDQSIWNFAQLKKIKNQTSFQNLKSLPQRKEKNGATMYFPENLEDTPFTEDIRRNRNIIKDFFNELLMLLH